MRITYDGGRAERAPRRICSLVSNEVIRGQGLGIKKKKKRPRKIKREKKNMVDQLFHYGWLIRPPDITHRPVENYGPLRRNEKSPSIFVGSANEYFMDGTNDARAFLSPRRG